MQICYESNLQCKFTTLPNDYKIAICLVYIFNVFQTIYIRLSVSVSQIIQIFKCKVNIKCYIFNNAVTPHTFLAFYLHCGPGTHNSCFFPSYLIITLNVNLFAITLTFYNYHCKSCFQCSRNNCES